MRTTAFAGYLFFCSIILSCVESKAQVNFYDINSIQKIEIYFSQPNWDYQLDTSKHGVDGYIVADWVKINGVQYNQVGVKYKGNSSYDSTYLKNPLHIELNHVVEQSYQGFTNIKLSNGYADPSAIREVLSYEILRKYMDCPRSNFARVYINGSYTGLYSNDESINKKFCSRNFNSSNGTFIKCSPVVTPGPTTKSNLRYIPGADSTSYFNFYEMQSDHGWNDLVNLCDTVTNHPGEIEMIFDVDRLLWMLAYNTVLVNLDSYTGVFCQNYYLYRDKNNRYNPIVWDLNMSFGGFPFVGSGGTSMAALTIQNMVQLSPTFHDTDPFWPLINIVMSNPSYKKQFIAHARTINNENFVTGSYANTAFQLQVLIDSAVQADINAFYSYNEFLNGMDTDYPFGSYMVPGIANLMDNRSTYLQAHPDFQLAPPSIISVTASNLTPELNETVTITALVLNTDSVFIVYRSSTSDKFVRVPMYDDGMHNDGGANDGIFGVEISITSFLTQYYIYAENSDAAMFSPERAEHEYYLLETDWEIPLQGQVVINEFVAVNNNGPVNEYGDRVDWIELYNNTSTSLSLYGLYLTDDFERMAKFAFPEDAIIPPDDFLIVWADEENSTQDYLHANFRLAAAGEQLMLSNGFSVIVDSVTYGQQLDDVSTGRCPNGTGNFEFIGVPSFKDFNCITDSTDTWSHGWGNLMIYPNPVGNYFNFLVNDTPIVDEIRIFDFMGKMVKSVSPVNYKMIDVYALSAGVYVIEFSNKTTGDLRRVKMVKGTNHSY